MGKACWYYLDALVFGILEAIVRFSLLEILCGPRFGVVINASSFDLGCSFEIELLRLKTVIFIK